MVGSLRQWSWGLNKILRPRNRPIIVTTRFDRVKHVVNVERDEPPSRQELLLTPLHYAALLVGYAAFDTPSRTIRILIAESYISLRVKKKRYVNFELNKIVEKSNSSLYRMRSQI